MLPLLATGVFAGAEDKLSNEYGVNIHAMWEYKEVPQEFTMLDQADIRFVRSDFSWINLEKTPGNWSFERHDMELKEAEKHHITLLPILGYAPPWGTPAQDHLDLWLPAVEKIVEHYQDKMHYWEIWNEHNYQVFWKNPNPKDYLKLLKPTAELIRKKAPNAKIVMGGTSQIPMQYIETLLKDGAGDYFDIMNIHPYSWYDIPEVELEKQITDLKKLMDKYQVKKDIWVTEMGWPSSPGGYLREFLPQALKIADIDLNQIKIAVVNDRNSPLSANSPGLDFNDLFPQAKAIKSITLDELDNLDPAEYPVLFPAPGETFSPESRHLDALQKYVKNGGLAVFPRGVPFYNANRKNKDGIWEKGWIDKSFRTKLRFEFNAWWINREVPMPKNFNARISPELGNKLKLEKLYGSNSFIIPVGFAGNDKLISLVDGTADNMTVPIAAYIKFDSDYKGGIIVSTINWMGMAPVSEDLQAKLLPRTILICFKSGIKKVFWYEFQAMETNPGDPEHYFGIVHKDLAEKPAYAAYAALAKMRPAGSTVPDVRQVNGIYLANWIKPDGNKGYALWSTAEAQPVTLTLTGTLREARDYLGKTVQLDVNQNTIQTNISGGILYLDGPETLEIK